MTGEVPPDEEIVPADEQPAAVELVNDQQLEGEGEDGDADDDEEHEKGDDKFPGASAPVAAAGTPTARAHQRDTAPRQGASVQVSRTSRTAVGEEDVPYIDDRPSKFWVGAVAAVFIVILAYALLFGKGGMFSPPPPTLPPEPTAAPSVSISPSAVPSSSFAASPSAVPSVSASIVPSVAPSAAPSAAPSVAPSVAPSAARSAAPSAAPSVAASPGAS